MQWRADFPMLNGTGKHLIYLDSAATAQKPYAVIEAIRTFYAEQYSTVHRAVYQLAAATTERYQGVRRQVQRFLNAAHAEEIIFTKGTTEGINLVASSFGKAFIKARDEIIITEMEHHSNIVPWQMLAEERGAILRVLPIDERGVLDLDVYRNLLSTRTRIVAFTHISNVLGTVNPAREMIALAHAAGAYTLVDGAQAAPHQLVDVQALGADFYLFSGHKAYGPTGVGVLYGKKQLLEVMPPYQGGGDMIEQVTFAKTSYNALPMKFEAGTPMIAEVLGLGAALEYLEKLGLSQIYAWEQELLKYATQLLLEIPGVKIVGNAPEKGAIISFTMDKLHPLDVATLLDLQGIAIRSGHQCAQPLMHKLGLSSLSRASFGLYTSRQDIEKWVAALKSMRERFA